MKKHLHLFLYALSITICVLFYLFHPYFVRLNKHSKQTSIISWGFVPNTFEHTPMPTAGGLDLLNKHNGIFVGNTQKKEIYFTFDLGSESGFTDSILNILKVNNLKAIFFLGGDYISEERLIHRMITEGHLIGNHTNKHEDLPMLSKKNIKKDIFTFQENFKNSYPNYEVKFFRPPYGRFDRRVLKIAQASGMKSVLWSIAIVDWEEAPPLDITLNANKIAQRLHPGAILLLHIRNPGAPELLKSLLPQIAEKGYRVGNPNDLLE